MNNDSIKEKFYEYLGKNDSLQGYVKSYKLVFYKCFFELLSFNNRVSADDLTIRFMDFYIERKRLGLLPDKGVDKVIADIEEDSSKDSSRIGNVYNLILRNPFKHINERNFILKKSENGKEYFILADELLNTLNGEELNKIVVLVRKKLKLYYARIDNDQEEKNMGDNKENLAIIKRYIANKGFSYDNNLIENFYLSLRSKPFVLLAGTSGTGKTRLAKLFAEAIGAFPERYLMVAVKPDWSDSSDLFGHCNLNGKFIPGPILEFIKKAETDLSKPYFLCFDEMNLARVEYYFSDFLSIIETRDRIDGAIKSEKLINESYYGADTEAKDKYGDISLPENLYIIGTVNMDETTFPFSRKVLDRANTIEFSYVDLVPVIPDMEESVEVAALDISNDFLKTKFLFLQDCYKEYGEKVLGYCLELQNINKILQKTNSHIGYRVRDEIIFYLLNNYDNGLISEEEAMDNELIQKILPRIQGSSLAIREMLYNLYDLCSWQEQGSFQNENSSVLMEKADSCRYPNSARKIAFMLKKYEEDGFTSYWL